MRVAESCAGGEIFPAVSVNVAETVIVLPGDGAGKVVPMNPLPISVVVRVNC